MANDAPPSPGGDAAAEGGVAPTKLEPSPLDYGWRRGNGVIAANPSALVEQPRTTGMPAEPLKTSAELQLDLGVAMLTCPVSSKECRLQLGAVAAVLLLKRPVPWFSWGGSIEAQQFGQTWNLAGEVWTLEQRAFSGRLLANVHLPDLANVDPYVGISLGGGAVHDVVRQADAAEKSSWRSSPLYGARAGLAFQVSQHVKVGALVDWTSIQVTTGESCPWTVGGVCSSNNWNAFSPSNALWNASATVSFAFGEEL